MAATAMEMEKEGVKKQTESKVNLLQDGLIDVGTGFSASVAMEKEKMNVILIDKFGDKGAMG